jgi:hypothetical protein
LTLATFKSITIQGILRLTTACYLLAVYAYVACRNQHADEETVDGMLKDLQDKNIDVSQLVDGKADHCQQAESSTERGSTA